MFHAIEASLSEPHTSVTSLQVCMCMLARLVQWHMYWGQTNRSLCDKSTKIGTNIHYYIYYEHFQILRHVKLYLCQPWWAKSKMAAIQ